MASTITATELQALANQYTKSSGLTYVSDDTTYWSLMTRRLKVMSEATFRLYHDAIDFTLTANQSTYDYTTASAAFTISGTQRKLLHVTNVVINGSPLRTFSGTVGCVSQDEMDDMWPEYRTADADVPHKWWETDPGVLHVAAKPTATVISTGSNYVSAFYSHFVITAGADVLLFKQEDLEYLAMDLAYHLGLAYSQPDTSGFSKLNYYRQVADEWAGEAKRNAIAQFATPSIRGGARRGSWVNLA